MLWVIELKQQFLLSKTELYSYVRCWPGEPSRTITWGNTTEDPSRVFNQACQERMRLLDLVFHAIALGRTQRTLT